MTSVAPSSRSIRPGPAEAPPYQTPALYVLASSLLRARLLTTNRGVIQIWLEDASERARVGENGRRVVQENQGAVDRLFSLIERRLAL